MVVQIAINGNRNDQVVPKTTNSILDAAISSIHKGATSVHFHPRDDQGKETLIGKFVDEQIGELRGIIENIPIGISTGEWIEPDLTRRLELIEKWQVPPDFVSINYDEPGSDQVTEVITKKGIKIEAGLNSLASAQNFTASHPKGEFLRILIEPQEQILEEAIQNINEIKDHLKPYNLPFPYLLHGYDATCWDLLKMALDQGYETRIGFEDTLTLPNGEAAKSNEQLIEQAMRIGASCQ